MKVKGNDKKQINDIISSLISFLEKYTEKISTSPAFIQRAQSFQNEFYSTNTDLLEEKWDTLISDINRSIKRRNPKDASTIAFTHLTRMKTLISEFQRGSSISVLDKRALRQICDAALENLSVAESHVTSRDMVNALLVCETIKKDLSVLLSDPNYKSKKQAELFRSLNSLVSVLTDATMELPQEVSRFSDVISGLKGESGGKSTVRTSLPQVRTIQKKTVRSTTPPARRQSKIPTRAPLERRKSETMSERSMPSILSSRRTIQSQQEIKPKTLTPTEKPATNPPLLGKVSDSESDLMMSAISRAMVSPTHELLAKAMRGFVGQGEVLEERLKVIHRVEELCQRFCTTFGRSEIVARFLVKIGEFKIKPSPEKLKEIEAMIDAVEKEFEQANIKSLLTFDTENERIKQMRSNKRITGFMKNESNRLTELTEQMKAGIHTCTIPRDTAKLRDSELIEKIREMHAKIAKLRGSKAGEEMRNSLNELNNSEAEFIKHYRVANEQIMKLLTARAKLLDESLQRVPVRGMKVTLEQLDQEMGQIIERKSKVIKGLSRVAKERTRTLQEVEFQ